VGVEGHSTGGKRVKMNEAKPRCLMSGRAGPAPVKSANLFAKRLWISIGQLAKHMGGRAQGFVPKANLPPPGTAARLGPISSE
jgi:hypothetical protein